MPEHTPTSPAAAASARPHKEKAPKKAFRLPKPASIEDFGWVMVVSVLICAWHGLMGLIVSFIEMKPHIAWIPVCLPLPVVEVMLLLWWVEEIKRTFTR